MFILFYFIVVLFCFSVLHCSCSKDINDYCVYSGDALTMKIDSLKQLYGNENVDIEYASDCRLSEDGLNQLEQELRKSLKYKSAEWDYGDDDELILHCLTAYYDDGGTNTIGGNYNDITSYRINGVDGYHLDGTPSSVLTFHEKCVYFKVEFSALYYPYASLSFEGVFEVNLKTGHVQWVEDEVFYHGGLWDWSPGKFKYDYNEVAIASEYVGSKKCKIIDKLTGGLITLNKKERFIFIIYNVILGDWLNFQSSKSFTMRGYFADEA